MLKICQDLDLNCKVVNMGNFFKNEKNTDICNVLKTFAHSAVIGMQGAENIYAHYVFGRLLLTVPNSKTLDVSEEINTYRFGATLISDEVHVAKNLVSRQPAFPFDWFHLEFTAHFGNTLRPISGDLDINSITYIKHHTTKHQCKVNPVYCADFTANVTQIRAELEALIEEGHLLTIEERK